MVLQPSLKPLACFKMRGQQWHCNSMAIVSNLHEPSTVADEPSTVAEATPFLMF